MPALDRNVKVTCRNCGTSVKKKHLSRHKLRCTGGTLYCPKSPNLSTESGDDINYHIAKKHETPPERITHKCKICFKEFSVFFTLRQHNAGEHGNQMKSPQFDLNDLLEDDDANLKEELEACQRFLVDSELEKGRHRVFSFAMSIPDNSLINKKLDLVFKGLKALPKLTLRLDLFSKTLKTDRVDTFMLIRTIRLWRGRKLCVHQTTLPTWTRINRNLILLIFVHEKEPIPTGNFTNWQIWQFLQRY